MDKKSNKMELSGKLSSLIRLYNDCRGKSVKTTRET